MDKWLTVDNLSKVMPMLDAYDDEVICLLYRCQRNRFAVLLRRNALNVHSLPSKYFCMIKRRNKGNRP